MSASQSRRWTRAEVIALVEANPLHTPRYELVDGELLVTPSPTRFHQRAVRELILALHPYVERTRIGELLDSPFDVELEPETSVQPDVFVLPPHESRRSKLPARELVLAVEVTSPGSVRHDRGRKRALYQRRVPQYWIVDLDAHLVERWQPNDARPEILRERIEWQPEGAAEGFVLELDPFFARIFGEEE